MNRPFVSPHPRRAVARNLAVLTAIAAVVFWLAPGHQAASNPAKPGPAEPAPMPRLAEPAPLFAEVEPAKNPVRLCLQDDGRKVLGWISGTTDYEGRRSASAQGDKNVGRGRDREGQHVHLGVQARQADPGDVPGPPRMEAGAPGHDHRGPGRGREGAERLLRRRSHRLPADAVAALRRVPAPAERGRRLRPDRQRRRSMSTSSRSRSRPRRSR